MKILYAFALSVALHSLAHAQNETTSIQGGAAAETTEVAALPSGGSSSGAAMPQETLQQLQQLLQSQMVGKTPAVGAAAELDLAGLKQKYQNSLVKIEFTLVTNTEETKFNPTKSESNYADEDPPHGTGFFISQSDILTNAHVVEDARAGSIRIKSPATGNVEFKADVVGLGWSESIDLAVLRLAPDELARFKKRAGLTDIPVLKFGDSDKVHQADPLAVFGYPESSDELKIIQAKVTGRQYLRTGFDEFVCGHQFIEVGPGGVVQPGNSGGPALNADGEVVAIPSRGSWRATQGWLIPSRVALRFLDKIQKNEKGKKNIEIPDLGMSLTENFAGTAVWTGADEDLITYELGVVVRDVIPGSLADQWGLKPNDILVGFSNDREKISCALDFKGYRVTTGRMSTWPNVASSAPASQPATTQASQPKNSDDPSAEGEKLHIKELIMCSEPGDKITLWYLRKGEPLQTMTHELQYKQPVKLTHLGPYEKPDFELWGDFVAQDFNDYNVRLFEMPPEQILKGGALVTFVEPNSLASRRGMKPESRAPFGFAFSSEQEAITRWVVIDSVNGQPVKNLRDLRDALRKAEAMFEAKQKEPGFDPTKRSMMKERYVQIGFRTNTTEGRVLHLSPGFPIDDALECRSVLKGFQTAMAENKG